MRGWDCIQDWDFMKKEGWKIWRKIHRKYKEMEEENVENSQMILSYIASIYSDCAYIFNNKEDVNAFRKKIPKIIEECKTLKEFKKAFGDELKRIHYEK